VFLLVLKNLLFTVIPATVAICVPFLLTASGRSSASGAVAVAAYSLMFVGGLIYFRCLWDFLSFGRGTPAPIDAPKKLVIRGLYRYVRNPMYVGVLTVILGLSVLFRTPGLLLYGLALGTCFHLFVTRYEEPHLRRVFGRDYDDYRARVGRWLPRRTRSH
jgi:protein-S-isoprenylcysteine O-methyltransferase Ste14